MILELVKMAGVGIISSFFTYLLASRGFRHRKWWELKVAAYKDTIEALSDLLHYYDRHFEAEARQQDVTHAIAEQLKDIWMDCSKRIKRSAYSGAFLFSNEAEVALKEFVKAIDRHPDQYKTSIEYYDAGYGTARKCLNSLVNCSKNDLKLKE